MITMTIKPEKTCTIDRLVTQPKLVEMVISGHKTQQRRNGVYGWPGERFNLDGRVFVITDLRRQTIGEMTDEDARAEGFANMEAYKKAILHFHSAMSWNENGEVWVHCFEEAGK